METKYYQTLDRVKEIYPDMSEQEAVFAAPKVEDIEEQLFGFIMFLCY